jgi:large subunit ribosomal protein L31
MKKGIHPEYVECIVHCGCGSTWTTRSTQKSIKVEICSSCHPFFRGGGTRVVDAMGRVDRFTKKFGSDYFTKTDKKKPTTKPQR